MLPTATRSATVQAPLLDTSAWDTVQSWGYQLTDYPNDRLDEIAASGYDLVVIDLARDGSTDYFTFEEIRNIQATGKVVLAYFEIGAIENYRPEWATVPRDLKLGPVTSWPGEQHVRYWDPRWWPVVQGRIDRALAAGFDGAYLDMVVTYEQISGRDTGLSIKERAQAMVDLIVNISTYAKDRNPAFKIVPQNAPELHGWPGYLNAIDGLGMEELYFRATDRPCTPRWCAENREATLAVRAAGKLVLTVDYATRPDNVRAAYAQARADGFVPYVATVELDRLSDQP
jgi:cysteinyl-tRNA synthetase